MFIIGGIVVILVIIGVILGLYFGTNAFGNNPPPVDGGWTEWSSEKCDKDCGAGKELSTRSCANPSPEHGGKDCEGESTKLEDCKVKECPIHGGWTEWLSGKCDKECGLGKVISTRTCTNPKAEHDGKECEGELEKTEDCKVKECPIDGKLSDFTNVGTCSKTCGGGTQQQTRTCTAPLNGGKACEGSVTRAVPCNTRNCPINGGWTAFTNSGSCSASCGGGSQVQKRSCTNPAPLYGGNTCIGSDTQTITCNPQPCPVLPTGGVLSKTKTIQSPSGNNKVVMQEDCNLVYYNKDGKAVWASGTNGKGSDCTTKMQEDCNLVVYDGKNVPLWSSNTQGKGNKCTLQIQDDNKMVVYNDSKQSIWSN